MPFDFPSVPTNNNALDASGRAFGLEGELSCLNEAGAAAAIAVAGARGDIWEEERAGGGLELGKSLA